MVSSFSCIFDKFINLKTSFPFCLGKTVRLLFKVFFSLIISTSCFKQADYTKVSDLSAARKPYTCARTPTHTAFDLD